jgi:hypothetical protein
VCDLEKKTNVVTEEGEAPLGGYHAKREREKKGYTFGFLREILVRRFVIVL